MFLATSVIADWRQDYLEALQAAEAGAWQAAEGRLRAAIAGRPEARRRARLVGAIPQPYLPHYWLGRAAFEQGDCAAAAESWTTSLEQGAVRSEADLWASLEEDLGHCSALVELQRRSATTAGSEGEALRRELASLAARRAFDDLAGLRQRLDDLIERQSTDQDPALGSSAPPMALPTEVAAEPSREDSREGPIEPAAPPVDPAVESAAVTVVSEASPSPDDSREGATEVPSEAARSGPGGPDAAAVVVAPWRRGAEEYFAGRYRAALGELAGVGGGPAALLRAASHFALWRLSGEQAEEQRAAMARELAACHRLAPDLEPAAALFPPPFRTLFAAAEP